MTPPAGPPSPDLLASGDDGPVRERGPWARRTALAVAAVAAAVGAGVLVAQDRDRDAQRRLTAAQQDVVRLSILPPGQDGAPRYGPRRPGIHVVVANDGPVAVELRRGSLTPGAWQVGVPAGRALRPGRSRMLELRPPRACGTVQPEVLRVEAVPPSGRSSTSVLDLTSAQLAYGGTLADAVAAAELDCDPARPAGSDGRPAPHPSEVVRPSR